MYEMWPDPDMDKIVEIRPNSDSQIGYPFIPSHNRPRTIPLICTLW